MDGFRRVGADSLPGLEYFRFSGLSVLSPQITARNQTFIQKKGILIQNISTTLSIPRGVGVNFLRGLEYFKFFELSLITLQINSRKKSKIYFKICILIQSTSLILIIRLWMDFGGVGADYLGDFLRGL